MSGEIQMIEASEREIMTAEAVAELTEQRDEARAGEAFWREQYEFERKRYRDMAKRTQEKREQLLAAESERRTRILERACCSAVFGLCAGAGMAILTHLLGM